MVARFVHFSFVHSFVRLFIRSFTAGGGYLGVCSGGFMASLPYFKLLGADLVDTEHWDRYAVVMDVRVRVTFCCTGMCCVVK